MRPRTVISPELTAIASTQHGVLTSQQLSEHGITRKVLHRMARDGTLRHVVRGHYSIAPDSWQTYAQIGAMVGGPSAAVGGPHALKLLGMDMRALEPLPEQITVWVQPRYRAETRRFWRFRHDGAGRLERAGSVRRVIDRHDAVLDTCADSAPGQAAALVLDLAREQQVDLRRLRELLDSRTRHRHRWFLKELLADAADGVNSSLESLYVTCIERPHRLLTPIRQVLIGGGVADGWFPEQQVTLELDGWDYHKDTIRADARRDNRRASMGIINLHIGWEDVIERPCHTAQVVARTLQTRGWQGVMQQCPRCPDALAIAA